MIAGKSRCRWRIILSIIILLIIIMVNYILIFIADSTIVKKELFREEGLLDVNKIIPMNTSAISYYSIKYNVYSNLTLYSRNCSIILIGVREGRVFNIVLNEGNNTVSLISENGDIYNVTESHGITHYTYVLYSFEKPYRYLSIVAFLLSIIIFCLSLYLFISFITGRWMCEE